MTKRRNSYIDLWRVIAAFIIASHHKYITGIQSVTFCSGWIFVEFYLLLTGFFTMKHFSKVDNHSMENIFDNSWKYTINKFKAFVPYIFVSLSVMFCIDVFIEKCPLSKCIVALLLETFMLNQGSFRLIYEFWYFSALLFVFPIFCCFCQIPSKYCKYILAFTFVAMYYSWVGFNCDWQLPMNLLRVFGGLLVGMLVYYSSEWMRKFDFHSSFRIVFTFIELAFILNAVRLAYINSTDFPTIFVCICVGCAFMLSGVTYTSRFYCPIFDWIGKLGLVIYIVHVPIGKTLKILSIDSQYVLIVYYLAIIVFAVFFMMLIEKGKKNILMKR